MLSQLNLAVLANILNILLLPLWDNGPCGIHAAGVSRSVTISEGSHCWLNGIYGSTPATRLYSHPLGDISVVSKFKM
jgi:hypothetical protein